MDGIDQVLNPESASFWNLVLAIAVIALSTFVARLVRRRTRTAVEAANVEATSAALVGRMAGWGVVFLGVVFALSILGFDMVPFVALIILVAAFAFFAGKSLIENWAAGLLLQGRGPYKVGDRVDSQGYSGYVTETNARSLILRTADGQIVHLPNIDVLTSPLVNRSGEEGRRRSSLVFGVADDSEMSEVEATLVRAAAATDGVEEAIPPTAHIASVGETTINVELRFWHTYADRHRVRSTVTHQVLRAFAESGIVMPYPTRTLIVQEMPDV